MTLLIYMSQALIPFTVLVITGIALTRHAALYDCFVRGAEEGIRTVVRIAPSLVGLMAATGVLRASGLLDLLSSALAGLLCYVPFPGELIPLAVIRMFSSSAATGLLLDVYKEFGTDSQIGLTASLMMCCTETIFYTMSLYFMTAGIKKTRHTLAGALTATAAGITASVILAGWMQ